MCLSCWDERGSPSINSAKTREAAVWVARVYDFAVTGGPLHIQFSDWNIDDGYFKETILDLEVHYWPAWLDDFTDEQIETCRTAYLKFKSLTEAERASALAIYDGYI